MLPHPVDLLRLGFAIAGVGVKALVPYCNATLRGLPDQSNGRRPSMRPHDELALPSPGCPRLQRRRRLVPDPGGIDHKSSITLHLQLIWWFSGVAAPF